MILKELLESDTPEAKRERLSNILKQYQAQRAQIEKNSAGVSKAAELKYIDKKIENVKLDLDDCDLSDKFA